ncbi:DNA alkylation repair protein [Aeromicrobium sp.]|uniref:DNA alkylation repair protein n=1 Tax=Aeromicrobium sp. TaxID=1871063 RepID=UPI002FC6F49C
MTELTAVAFAERVHALQSDEELRKIQRYFRSGPGEYAEGDTFIGVRMGHLFDLAKEHLDMPIGELETLLESPIHEMRVGALSIMGKKSAHKKSTDDERRALFELYLRRHDRINNWDLVDLAARHTVGGWLLDKPRDVLHELARSEVIWERRTACYACFPIIANGETEDALAISAVLIADPEELIHKAVGTVLRSVGGVNRDALLSFLEQHAASMPRIMLTYAIEHLDPDEKARFRAMR